MARKKAQKRKADAPQEVSVKVTPEVTENTASYYSNYVAATHSRYDFTLIFARLPSTFTLKPEQHEIVKSGRPLPVEADLQVVVAPQLIPALVDTLIKQKERYESLFGSIEKGK